eukprot:Nitzschia sp. Nitz4//scaffold52_size167869//26263//27633//NITZ4_002262-RA/size167869-processed-gene-0.152-mRNA-1//-1//CDS//3329553993//1196//frame0
MPIDLKWVRDHPDLVQEWQCLRYPQEQQQSNIPPDDTTSTSAAPSVVQIQAWDTQARQLLFQTNQLRRSIKQLSRQLRQATDKSELTRQQQELETLSKQYQHLGTQRDVALQSLGSPLDVQVLEAYTSIEVMSIPEMDSAKPMSLQYWQVVQQIHYGCVSRFPGIQVHGLDHATSTHPNDTNHRYQQQHAVHVDMWGSRSSPPTYITWLAQQVSPMIWGAKQLPQMALLESNEAHPGVSVDLIGLTSGTTWDARSLQMEWMEECREFFQSLFVVGNGQRMKVVVRSVPPTQLEQHEQSRLVLLLHIVNNHVGDTNSTDESGQWFPLAQVSNLGDAPARALQQQFQGGGLHSSKGYVYMVHARILSTPWLLAVLQELDKNGMPMDMLRLQSNPSLVGYACTASVHGNTTSASSKKSKKKSIFQSRVPATSTSRLFLSLKKSSGASEALTCPFGFLVQ